MKNLIMSIVLFSLVSVSAFANGSPIVEKFSIDAISFEMKSTDAAHLVLDVVYNKTANELSIETIEEVSFLQVLDATGVLQYQLPINSKNVNLDLNDFDLGSYQLNLSFGEEKVIRSTFNK